MAPRDSTNRLTETDALLPQSLPIDSDEHRHHVLAKARRLLYVSHFFSQFSEVAWQFCIVIFLAAFKNYKSLLLVSTYGLLSGLCVFLFGGTAGRFVDGTNRLVAARRFILSQNLCVVCATALCYVLLGLQYDNHESDLPGGTFTSTSWTMALLVGIHALGAWAQLLDRGFTVAIERDWIVVMSRYLPTISSAQAQINPSALLSRSWLAHTNVVMKQIDLGCKVVAPAVAGYFLALVDDGTHDDHGRNLRAAAVFVGMINFLALLVEFICTTIIYDLIPSLATKVASKQPSPTRTNHEVASMQATSYACQFPFLQDFEIFLRQNVAYAGLAISLLYLNILTFGAIMTAYLVWRGMKMDMVGLWRGISSAAGLSGTFAYAISSRHLSTAATGMWSITFQFLCLSLSYFSLFVDNNTTSLAMFIAGVCASRGGLWVFDIAVTQLMQDNVGEDVRGLVGGVQQSINAFFGLLSFALGIFIPDPRDFHIYVAIGYGSVGAGLLCYGLGIWMRRSKLGLIQE